MDLKSFEVRSGKNSMGWRVLFLVVIVLFLVPTLRAQGDLAGKIFCRQD